MIVTVDMLRRIAPGASPFIVAHLAPALTARMDGAGLSTHLRASHFLAQAAHESAGFKTLVEYGSEAYLRRYEGRRDLGNTRPGDGPRYRGRGIFQLTGRANYRTFGARLNLDLENNPSKAAEPDVSVQTALAYWSDRRLSLLADKDDLRGITKRINGGFNGLADRQAKLIRAKAAIAARPASEAVEEIRKLGAASTVTGKRAAAGTAAAATGSVATTGATIAPQVPESQPQGGAWLAIAIVGTFVVVAIGLAVFARRKLNEGAVLTADAAKGTGDEPL